MSRITLHPGERLIAQVKQDREVAILSEALWGVMGLLAITTAFYLFDRASGPQAQRAWLGTLVTVAFMVGPIAAQRLFRPMPVYWLTDRRLVLDATTDVALADIRGIRVWLTGLTLRTDSKRHALRMLVNPFAVAALLRDTIAGKESA